MSKLWRTDRIKRPGYPPRPTQHANTADATVSLTRLPEHLCSESGPHKPSSLIHQEPIMSQTRASIPYVTAFTPQENSNVSPNGSMSKLTILQPFGVNPDNPPHSREAKDSLVQLECTTLEEFVLLGKRLGRRTTHGANTHAWLTSAPSSA